MEKEYIELITMPDGDMQVGRDELMLANTAAARLYDWRSPSFVSFSRAFLPRSFMKSMTCRADIACFSFSICPYNPVATASKFS